MVEGSRKRGIQLGHVQRGRVWGRGGVALDKHGLVAVELAGSLSRDQLSLLDWRRRRTKAQAG